MPRIVGLRIEQVDAGFRCFARAAVRGARILSKDEASYGGAFGSRWHLTCSSTVELPNVVIQLAARPANCGEMSARGGGPKLKLAEGQTQ
jgi:hypothetical protein